MLRDGFCSGAEKQWKGSSVDPNLSKAGVSFFNFPLQSVHDTCEEKRMHPNQIYLAEMHAEFRMPLKLGLDPVYCQDINA